MSRRSPKAKKASNHYLSKARKAKNDEFYTQLPDIENELKHYKDQFKGKVVLCNCDDPFESNFFKFFALNFNFYGLKKLIVTSYTKSPIAGQTLPLFEIEGLQPDGKEPYAFEINEIPDQNQDGAVDMADIVYLVMHDANVAYPIKGDHEHVAGDFRSHQCVELLKQADMVVTNPPFSLFREYVELLVQHEKKFLIVGSQNAVTYKEIFKLIKDNKLWQGYGFKAGNAYFGIPQSKVKAFADGVYDEKSGLVKFRNVCWFTNMDHKKRHEEITLFRRYKDAPERYPKYDNYDAIEVGKVADIPEDYEGEMGVPITFLDKYNPNQFEIVGSFNAGVHGEELGASKTLAISKGRKIYWNGPVVNQEPLFKRIVIRRRRS